MISWKEKGVGGGGFLKQARRRDLLHVEVNCGRRGNQGLLRRRLPRACQLTTAAPSSDNEVRDFGPGACNQARPWFTRGHHQGALGAEEDSVRALTSMANFSPSPLPPLRCRRMLDSIVLHLVVHLCVYVDSGIRRGPLFATR